MMFLFLCPQCGDQKKLARQSIGRRMRCPNCEALIEVELPREAELEEASAGVTTETAESRMPVITGVAVARPPEPEADWSVKPPDAVPGVPVLPIEDEEESEKVIVRSQPEEADMDMTPMVDVTFLLLIFFMVTASFTVQKSLPIPPPMDEEASAAPVQSLNDMQNDGDAITVRIDQFGTYFITSSHWDDEIECPSEQELMVRIREARQPDASGSVPSKMLVVAHGDALHDRVVTAVDAGVGEGIDKVQLITSDDNEPL